MLTTGFFQAGDLILRHISKKSFSVFSAVSSAFAFKACKSANMIKSFCCFKKCDTGIKNAEFHADFESVGKVEKTHAKKVIK
jgi:hypothetical protein